MSNESQLESSSEMHSPERYRKNSTLRTVDLYRRPGGFGFTLSSQGPCVLSCILAGSPAHKAGLQPGDQIIEVNGTSVEQRPHEQVVKLIARSPNGTVKLGIRNRAETHNEAKEAKDTGTDEDNSEETVINDTILNRVDKVVEELRSGRLFGNSPSLNRSFSNGKFISEEEIVSDEELKATFCESIRSEIPVQNFSPGQSDSDATRRSNEGDSKSNLYTPKLSRVLYPAMTPIRRETSGSLADSDLEPELRALVGYLGSIELPAASCLPTCSLNAIRNCVRRLRAQQKVHIFFLMEISLVGIKLLDSQKRTVVTYPLRSLAFTGLCSDDKRVFGIVTRKTNESSSENILSNTQNYKTGEQNTVNCSCHVFSVDPELTSHDLHQDIAYKYGVQCTSHGGTECMEFPSSSSPILRSITGMFKERSGSESAGTSSDGEGYLAYRARSASLSSSQSESDVITRDTHPDELSEKASNNVIDEYDASLAHSKNLDQSVELEIYSQDNHLSATNSMQNEKATPVGYKHHTSETNDSGVGLDSFHRSDGIFQGNGTVVAVPPPVSVSSFHSSASSADSHLSMDSQHSSGGPFESGVPRKPQLSNSAVYQMGTNDSRSLGNSQESLAHSDIVLGHSSSKKPLHTCASISSSTQSIHSLGSMPGDMSHMDGRVTRWALGFDKLMEDPAGLGCLKEFLKKEFSEENIVFWISCENFRNINDFEELKEEAANIFHNHLDANAPMPVNVDSGAVKDAEEQLPHPNNDMFRLQQQQVYTLMKFDSYPRFLKSDVYRQCLVAEMEGVPLPFEEEEEVRESKGRGFFKKVPFLYPSSDDSELSSSSSRSSLSIDIKRSTRGRGSKHGSKRSTSTVDSERKKSFLPWKGKHFRKGDRSFGSQPGSARSSLSSLSDSIHNFSYSSESLQVDQRRESESFQFCRVILPDHSSTILLCKEGQTLRQALLHLCERRQLSFVAHEVFLGGTDKLVPLDELDEDMSIMGGREIIMEHRTLFRLEMPDGVTLYVKVKPSQTVRACLEPILARQGISFDHVTIHLAGCEVPLGSGVPVASIEHQLVVVETVEQRGGNVQSQRSPRFVGKPPFASRTSRRGSKNNTINDVAFEGVMRGKHHTLGSGYFDDTGVWVSTTSTSRSTESFEDGNRPEGSFGKSLLKGQGLFGRKRREGSEPDKGIPVDMKSERFGSERPGDVKDFFELISRAQAKRMDDQRGELKGNLELPDFLKLPVENRSAQSNDRSVIPNAPPPPLFRTADNNPRRPVVRKSLSTPAHLHEPVDFMQELAERLSKRSGSVKNNSTRTNAAVDNAQRHLKGELPFDYNFNSRGPTGQAHYRPHEVGAQEKGRNISRPRSATDAAAHKVDTKTGAQQVVPGNHSQPLGGTEPRKNIAHVHPSVRPQASQPVTVNSLRGMYHHSTRNPSDQAVYPHPRNAKPLTMTKASSKSSQSLRDHAPAIYDVKPGALAMDVRDDSINVSSVNAAFQKMISSYSLPEVNSQNAEVHVPCQGPPPVPRRQVFSGDRRPRPKPISNPHDLITGLENAPACHLSSSPSSGKVDRLPDSDLTVGSPLPPPPTPPSGPLYDLQIADFSPPPPIQEFPVLPTEPQGANVDDSSSVTQSAPQDRTFASSSTSSDGQGNDVGQLEFTGPVAYVNLPSDQTQRTHKYEKQFTSPHVSDCHKSVDGGDVTSAQLQRSSAVFGPGSLTPTVSKFNKTLTPPSSHEKTLVEDPSLGGTPPHAGDKPPMNRRLMSSPGTGSRVRRRDHEKRRSRQSSEITKLDPYVTYENEDLRITFV